VSATGLDVFDKTLQTTNIWLDEIMAELGPDRHVAWHVLGAVLRTVRDRVPLGLATHLGSQLPILVRGTYYDQWHVREKPLELRSADEFLERVQEGLAQTRPINARNAVRAVLATVTRHIDAGEVRKVRDALPKHIESLWPDEAAIAADEAQLRERIEAVKDAAQRQRRQRRAS
jgi:uncharacterized protein (DUF2267 family)